MVKPFLDLDRDLLDIVTAARDKVPILVEGERRRSEEREFTLWCKDIGHSFEFIASNGVETLISNLEALRPKLQAILAIIDRDLTSTSDVVKTLRPGYDGRIYYLPRYDYECYLLNPEAIWEYIQFNHFNKLDDLAEEWKGVDAIKAKFISYAEQSKPQTAGNILLRDLKNEQLEVPDDFEEIDPFLTSEQVLDSLTNLFPRREDEIESNYGNILEYIEDFFPDNYQHIISGKKFLLKSFFHHFPPNFIHRSTFNNFMLYFLSQHPPQDFVDLTKNTILPRTRDLLGA